MSLPKTERKSVPLGCFCTAIVVASCQPFQAGLWLVERGANCSSTSTGFRSCADSRASSAGDRSLWYASATAVICCQFSFIPVSFTLSSCAPIFLCLVQCDCCTKYWPQILLWTGNMSALVGSIIFFYLGKLIFSSSRKDEPAKTPYCLKPGQKLQYQFPYFRSPLIRQPRGIISSPQKITLKICQPLHFFNRSTIPKICQHLHLLQSLKISKFLSTIFFFAPQIRSYSH